MPNVNLYIDEELNERIEKFMREKNKKSKIDVILEILRNYFK